MHAQAGAFDPAVTSTAKQTKVRPGWTPVRSMASHNARSKAGLLGSPMYLSSYPATNGANDRQVVSPNQTADHIDRSPPLGL
jgi:hypothetical protein